MKRLCAGGGWPAIWYAIKKSREAGGVFRMYRALRAKNACKTCALGMGGQRGGMVNEAGRFPEVCKKSIQAMTADMRGAIRDGFFNDFTFEKLRHFSSRELEAAGRITTPLYAGPLDQGYRAISWEDAIERVARKMRDTIPDESFFYFSGRSSNEAGFLLQLVARLFGTNNVNNCSYYCHQASGVGLSSVTGSGTATITLDDLDTCDLVFLIGANPSCNHPRFMRTLVDLRRRGGRVIVINPLKELGLVRFKVPSDMRSLLFGSKIADEYLQPHIGGDIATLAGIAKAVLEYDTIDRAFTSEHADDWEDFRRSIEHIAWDTIVEASGVERATLERIAQIYAHSKNTIFAWAMGITHHAHGVENVQMIANLAMMRGMLGRPGAGLLPLRGHSNVQGMGSIGATPALKQAMFDRLERHFNVSLPQTPGLDTLGCMHAADEDRIRFAMHLGGNLFGSNPDSAFASRALSKIDMTLFLSTTLNTGHISGRGRESIILPVLARDEEQQSTTQESMFNYVRLSDGGTMRFQGPRSEVDVIASLAERVLDPSLPLDWKSMRLHGRLREAIAAIIPGYDAIGTIDQTKQEFHIAGRTFHEPRFATDTGRAKFHPVILPAGDHRPDRANGAHRTADNSASFRLMTVRSEGQFNTVVYEDEDLYRGQDRRDVIMLHRRDIDRLGLSVDQPVTVRSDTGTCENILIREIDIRSGNAVMYYPEANILIPKTADPKSKTPAFKNTRIEIIT